VMSTLGFAKRADAGSMSDKPHNANSALAGVFNFIFLP
jgi:hypothetical protein